MDLAVEFFNKRICDKHVLALINQIRLVKKMYLPFELVRLEGAYETKEFYEVSKISCVKWKFNIDKIPSSSNKTKRISKEFIKWIKDKKICIRMNFDRYCTYKYEILVDKEFIKENLGNRQNIIRRKNIIIEEINIKCVNLSL